MRRTIKEHLGSHQVSRVVYGTIIVLALIVVLQDHPPSAGVALGSVLATAVAIGLAEFYSELVGEQVRTARRLDRRELVAVLEDVLAVAFGIAFPAVFFVLAAAGAMTVDTAISVAKWTGLGLIAFYGFCGARLAGRGVAGALVEAATVGLGGALLVVVKALVH